MAVRIPVDRTLVEESWPLGIVRDRNRRTIPAGGVYFMQDYLCDRGGLLYKRGGTGYHSSSLAGQTQVVAVMTPHFPGDPRIVCVATDGATTRTLYDVTGTSAAVGVTVLEGAQPKENPPFLLDKTILCDAVGDGLGSYSAPQKIYLTTGTVTIDYLGGSPPTAKYSCAHLSYLVLANGGNNQNRLWFSPVPDIESTWDTGSAYIDVPHEITGLASVSGVLLVFTRGSAYRVLGNVPPGTTGENMELQPLGAVGCIDARSIVSMNGLVYFADESGVYYTNGAGYESITAKKEGNGVSALWTAATADSANDPAHVCAGVWRNQYLFLTASHPAGSRVQFLYDATTGSWTTLADATTAAMYATKSSPAPEIFVACGDSGDPPRLLKLSQLFAPAAANKRDANGEDVEPTVTFRTMGDGGGEKAWGYGHLTYKVEQDLSDNDGATLTVAVAEGIGNDLPLLTFTDAATMDGEKRKRFTVNRDAAAVTVRVAQTGASALTELYALEVETRPYDEPSEVAA